MLQDPTTHQNGDGRVIPLTLVQEPSVNGSYPQSYTKLVVPVQESLKFIPLLDMIRLEADGSYTNLHLVKGEMVLVSRGLQEVSDSIDFNPFIRVHRSHVINLHFIKEILKQGRQHIAIMADLSEISVSRRYYNDLMKAIKEHYHHLS